MVNGICGSDIHFYHVGKLGNFVVTKPYVPGHEACGIVAATGTGVYGFSEGDHVVIEPGISCGSCSFCRSGRYNLCPQVIFLSAPPINGTFCDYIVIPSSSIHPMPSKMTFEEGALVEPAAVAVHAVNRVQVQNGCTAVIFGCGSIGLMTLQAFKAAGGSKAICLDYLPLRRKTAQKQGAEIAIEPNAEGSSCIEQVDLVFETAGSSLTTKACFDYAKPGGRIVQVGWPEINRVEMDIACFLEKELLYTSVNRYANTFPAAIIWIASGRIKTEEIITHRFSFEDIDKAFEFTLRQRDKVIKTIVLNE